MNLAYVSSASNKPTVPNNIQFPKIESRSRLTIAGWIAGLEPVRLEVSGSQLVLEAGLEDRWLLGNLDAEEAEAAAQAFRAAREQVCGVQFLAVQSSENQNGCDGFWVLRDLPDA